VLYQAKYTGRKSIEMFSLLPPQLTKVLFFAPILPRQSRHPGRISSRA